MPEDLKLSQIGSSQLPPPFRGLHSPGVRKHCQIIFACYFRKSSIKHKRFRQRVFVRCKKIDIKYNEKEEGSEEEDKQGVDVKQCQQCIRRFKTTS